MYIYIESLAPVPLYLENPWNSLWRQNIFVTKNILEYLEGYLDWIAWSSFHSFKGTVSEFQETLRFTTVPLKPLYQNQWCGKYCRFSKLVLVFSSCTLVIENPQQKIISFRIYKHWYQNHAWSDKAFKGTVVHQALSSLHGGSLDVMLTVSLITAELKRQ